MSDRAPPLLGLAALDDRLRTVLPAGWLGLLEGDAGGGATLLAKHAAHAAAGLLPVVYCSTVETSEEVAAVLAGLGWSTEGIQLVDLDRGPFDAALARDLAVARARARGLNLEESTLRGALPAPNPAHHLPAHRLLADVAAFESPFRLILDRLDLTFEEMPAREVITIVRQLRHRAWTAGGGILLLVHPEVPEARTLALLEEIADFVLRLERTGPAEEAALGLQVRRVRNHPEATLPWTVTLAPDGLAIGPEPDGARAHRTR